MNDQSSSSSSCSIPTGETEAFIGWPAGPPIITTMGAWKAQLTPVTYDFSGFKVSESDGGGGADSCWYQGSHFAQHNTVTGGEWPVHANNWYALPGAANPPGPDLIGWFPNAIIFYRNQNRVPCGFKLNQIMSIKCNDHLHQYIVNTLVGDINANTITSKRGTGALQTKNA